MNILADLSTMKDVASAGADHYSNLYLDAELGSRDRAWYGFKMHQANAVYWALAAEESYDRARDEIYAGDSEINKAERATFRAEAKLHKARSNDHYQKAEACRAKWREL